MKKFTTLALLTASLIALPVSNCLAAWQELGANERMSVYVDVDTLKADGDKAQILSMLDFKKPGQNPKTKETVNSIVGINEYNCSNVTYRPIEYKKFSGNKGGGKVVSDNKTPDSQYEAVVNDSWTAGVFNVACRKK